MTLRQNANQIIRNTLDQVTPDEAVKKALQEKVFSAGKIILVAAGKAAWQMAYTAKEILGERIDSGIVVTKYDHVKAEISGLRCFEAGHPVPDENSFFATKAVLECTANLSKDDTVIFLLSGGGSALFEYPLISGEALSRLTNDLLACGADIVEMNTIRKRVSAVKGGRFAKHCEPANVYSIILSDIIGDPLDMIASGPAYPDSSTCADALRIVEKYQLPLGDEIVQLLKKETPKEVRNVETVVSGSVTSLCKEAIEQCELLGYETMLLTNTLTCEAREAGSFMAAIARTHSDSRKKLAFVAGGETIVHLKGTGKGGRNQEIALSAALGISGLNNVCIFSLGSDGTDGPTDAAGGYADGNTISTLKEQGIDAYKYLEDNNAYVALEKCEGLIKTGPTGTNVNDVTILLIN